MRNPLDEAAMILANAKRRSESFTYYHAMAKLLDTGIFNEQAAQNLLTGVCVSCKKHQPTTETFTVAEIVEQIERCVQKEQEQIGLHERLRDAHIDAMRRLSVGA